MKIKFLQNPVDKIMFSIFFVVCVGALLFTEISKREKEKEVRTIFERGFVQNDTTEYVYKQWPDLQFFEFKITNKKLELIQMNLQDVSVLFQKFSQESSKSLVIPLEQLHWKMSELQLGPVEDLIYYSGVHSWEWEVVTITDGGFIVKKTENPGDSIRKSIFISLE